MKVFILFKWDCHFSFDSKRQVNIFSTIERAEEEMRDMFSDYDINSNGARQWWIDDKDDGSTECSMSIEEFEVRE